MLYHLAIFRKCFYFVGFDFRCSEKSLKSGIAEPSDPRCQGEPRRLAAWTGPWAGEPGRGVLTGIWPWPLLYSLHLEATTELIIPSAPAPGAHPPSLPEISYSAGIKTCLSIRFPLIGYRLSETWFHFWTASIGKLCEIQKNKYTYLFQKNISRSEDFCYIKDIKHKLNNLGKLEKKWNWKWIFLFFPLKNQNKNF